MYQSSARVRSFFIAAATASLLAACSGGGMNATPSTVSTQNTQAAHNRTGMNGGQVTPTPVPTATPTPAPTATPAGSSTYKIVTGLQMDSSGNFSEVSSFCKEDAPSFYSSSAQSFDVNVTSLAVCRSDDDHRGDDAARHSMNSPQITPTPIPTATPGVATNLVIIRKTVSDEDDDNGWKRGDTVRSSKGWGWGWGRGNGDSNATVVLTNTATLANGTWTFTSTGSTNDLAAGKKYKFYVAKQVVDSDHNGWGDRGRDRH